MVAGHPQLPQAEAPAGSHFSMVPQAGHLTVGREGPGAGRFGLPSLASADLPLRLVKPRGCTWLPGLGGVGLGGVGFGEWALGSGPFHLDASAAVSQPSLLRGRTATGDVTHSLFKFNPSALQPSTVPFFFFFNIFFSIMFSTQCRLLLLCFSECVCS